MLGIMRRRKSRYTNRYEFAATGEWATLIRSRCTARPLKNEGSEIVETDQKCTVRPIKNERSGGPPSITEPSDLNLYTLPPTISNTLRSDQPHEEPAAPVAAAAAAEVRECVKQTFECLMDQYPSPGLAIRGLELLTDILREADDLWALAKRLAASGESWKLYWYRHPRAFQPQLWRWLSSGDWQFMPPEGRR
jgi:hypothetical protein